MFFRRKVFYICLLIVLQILYAVILVCCLESLSFYISLFFRAISFCLIVYISEKNQNVSFSFSWSVLILTFPMTGWVFYFLFERRKGKKILKRFESDVGEYSFYDKEDYPDDIKPVLQSVYNLTGAMVYSNTMTRFFSSGEDFYIDFINELKKAKKYIYFEYFIIDHGAIWNEIYDIVKEKALHGIDIRIIFDDMCCSMFTKKYRIKLETEGIYTAPFNKFRPFPDVFINYRDHRKITIIDGHTAFTGGINIADEYMNKKTRFGYWKDTVIMIKGRAVSEMKKIFVKMWNECSSIYITDMEDEQTVYDESGFVQPFGCVPGSNIGAAQMSYLKLINNAQRYIYITTPYLVPDAVIMNALCLSARSGVDVKIITPHIPDKWYIQIATRSNYKQLMQCGVRIYEYLPGFIHSKTIVTDDKLAILGTANFDFRSFYFLFENAVLMYKTDALRQMIEDFEKTLSVSFEFDTSTLKEISFIKRVLACFFKLIAPLM